MFINMEYLILFIYFAHLFFVVVNYFYNKASNKKLFLTYLFLLMLTIIMAVLLGYLFGFFGWCSGFFTSYSNPSPGLDGVSTTSKISSPSSLLDSTSNTSWSINYNYALVGFLFFFGVLVSVYFIYNGVEHANNMPVLIDDINVPGQLVEANIDVDHVNRLLDLAAQFGL